MLQAVELKQTRNVHRLWRGLEMLQWNHAASKLSLRCPWVQALQGTSCLWCKGACSGLCRMLLLCWLQTEALILSALTWPRRLWLLGQSGTVVFVLLQSLFTTSCHLSWVDWEKKEMHVDSTMRKHLEISNKHLKVYLVQGVYKIHFLYNDILRCTFCYQKKKSETTYFRLQSARAPSP